MSESPKGNGQSAFTEGQMPDEVRDWLRTANRQAKALAAANARLTSRITTLEGQLADAELTSDELVGRLPDKVDQVLASAKEVADELVAGARRREALICRKTDEHSRNVVRHAESEATAILGRAADEAVRTVNQAKSDRRSILAATKAHRDNVLSELRNESSVLEERVRQLRNAHDHLARAYDVVERTLAEAHGALRQALGAADSGNSGNPAPVRSADPVRADEKPSQSSPPTASWTA